MDLQGLKNEVRICTFLLYIVLVPNLINWTSRSRDTVFLSQGPRNTCFSKISYHNISFRKNTNFAIHSGQVRGSVAS
jgi:hypothetical protein